MDSIRTGWEKPYPKKKKKRIAGYFKGRGRDDIQNLIDAFPSSYIEYGRVSNTKYGRA